MWKPISTAPRDGTWILIGKLDWSVFPKAQWELIEDGEEPFFGWVFEDASHSIGVGDGALGWEEDHDEGRMPTVWATLPDEVDE